MAKALPVGSKRINHHGYVQIKTPDCPRRWPFEHRVVWEAANGPIPEGCYIHHLNEVKTDNRLENLILLPSRSVHFKVYHHELAVKLGEKVGASGKGKPKSPEHRAKIALALRGKPKSIGHRTNIGKAQRGRVVSEEEKQKIRDSMLKIWEKRKSL